MKYQGDKIDLQIRIKDKTFEYVLIEKNRTNNSVDVLAGLPEAGADITYVLNKIDNKWTIVEKDDRYSW